MELSQGRLGGIPGRLIAAAAAFFAYLSLSLLLFSLSLLPDTYARDTRTICLLLYSALDPRSLVLATRDSILGTWSAET
jgi:hypothetical protein